MIYRRYSKLTTKYHYCTLYIARCITGLAGLLFVLPFIAQHQERAAGASGHELATVTCFLLPLDFHSDIQVPHQKAFSIVFLQRNVLSPSWTNHTKPTCWTSPLLLLCEQHQEELLCPNREYRQGICSSVCHPQPSLRSARTNHDPNTRSGASNHNAFDAPRHPCQWGKSTQHSLALPREAISSPWSNHPQSPMQNSSFLAVPQQLHLRHRKAIAQKRSILFVFPSLVKITLSFLHAIKRYKMHKLQASCTCVKHHLVDK